MTRSFGNHFSGTVGVQYGVINTKTSSQDSSLAIPNTHLKSASVDIPLLLGYEINNARLLSTIHAGIGRSRRTVRRYPIRFPLDPETLNSRIIDYFAVR